MRYLENEDAQVVANAAWMLRIIGTERADLLTPERIKDFSVLYDKAQSEAAPFILDLMWELFLDHPDLITPELYDLFLAALLKPDEAVRAEALSQWQRSPTGLITVDVLQAVKHNLEDSDVAIKLGAYDTLMNLLSKRPELVTSELREALLQTLQDDDPIVRENALWPWLLIPMLDTSEVHATIFDMLHDPFSNVRRSAFDKIYYSSAFNPAYFIGSGIEVSDAQTVIERSYNYAIGNSQQFALLSEQLLANTALTDAVIERLLQTVNDENPESSITAAYALWNIISRHPDILNDAHVNKLTEMLDDKETRYNALFLLLRFIALTPDRATPDMVTTLVNSFADLEGEDRQRAIAILTKAFTEQGQLVTPTVREALVSLLTEKDDQLKSDATAVLWAWVLADGSQSQTALIAQLLSQMNNEDEAPKFIDIMEQVVMTNDNSIEIWRNVYQQNPELVRQVAEAFTRAGIFNEELNKGRESPVEAVVNWMANIDPEVAGFILTILVDQLTTNEDWNQLATAAGLANGLIEKNPERATEALTEALRERLHHKYEPVVQHVANSLEEIYKSSAYVPGELDQLYLDALLDPLNAAGRPILLNLLAKKALADPDRGQAIRVRLLEEADSRNPMQRYWTNKALQMWEVANLAHTAHNDPLQREDHEKTLNQYQQFSFLSDSAWMAIEALNWLESERYSFLNKQ